MRTVYREPCLLNLPASMFIYTQSKKGIQRRNLKIAHSFLCVSGSVRGCRKSPLSNVALFFSRSHMSLPLSPFPSSLLLHSPSFFSFPRRPLTYPSLYPFLPASHRKFTPLWDFQAPSPPLSLHSPSTFILSPCESSHSSFCNGFPLYAAMFEVWLHADTCSSDKTCIISY